MALVDYDSESGSETSAPERDHHQTGSSSISAEPGPAPKRRKLSSATASALPPLPSNFHDLYASTVRLSNTDDPSLHQGRRRQVPHIVGNWPSHLYIEWRPSGEEHELLGSLLSTLSSRLAPTSSSSSKPVNAANKPGSVGEDPPGIEIRDFLTSDLGAPLPLHISLSRPLSLTTAQKDGFLDKVKNTLAGSSSVSEFELGITALEWHRTHESSRSFLVLRVQSSSSSSSSSSMPLTPVAPPPARRRTSGSAEPPETKNVELGALLKHCNKICADFGQPELYAFKSTGEETKPAGSVGDAFHVSVAWSFAEPTEELRRATREVFEMKRYRNGLEKIRIQVDGVKAKVGNTVTHLPLSGTGRDSVSRERKGLFGYEP